MRIWIAGIVFLLAGGVAAEDVTLKVQRITETRAKDRREGENFGSFDGIQLLIHIDGDAVAGATKYGQTKLTEASADTGESLLEGKDGLRSMSDFGFVQIEDAEGMWGGNEQDEKKTGFDLTLQLKTAPRAAKSIKSLKGEVTVLVGGEEKIVEIKDPKSQAGKVIEDPALKEAGVTFRLISQKEAGEMGDAQQMLHAEITGDDSAIAEVKVLNAAGEDIKNGSWSSESGNKKQIGYMLGEAPDANTVLQLKLMVGQEAVKVPIELKDIELP